MRVQRLEVWNFLSEIIDHTWSIDSVLVGNQEISPFLEISHAGLIRFQRFCRIF